MMSVISSKNRYVIPVVNVKDSTSNIFTFRISFSTILLVRSKSVTISCAITTLKLAAGLLLRSSSFGRTK